MNSRNNMKLIMENWRKFSNDSLKNNILIETKYYNGSLNELILKNRSGKISLNDFEGIVCESLNQDLAELEKINKQILSEAGVIDTAKAVGSKIKSAVMEKIKNLINSSIAKLSALIKSGSKTVLNSILAINKTVDSLFKGGLKEQEEQTNPEVEPQQNVPAAAKKDNAKLFAAIKVFLIMAAVIYLFWPASAHAGIYIGGHTYGTTAAGNVASDTNVLMGILDAVSNMGVQGKALAQQMGLDLSSFGADQILDVVADLKSKLMSDKQFMVTDLTEAGRTVLEAATRFISKLHQGSEAGSGVAKSIMESLANAGDSILQTFQNGLQTLAQGAGKAAGDAASHAASAAAQGLHLVGQTATAKIQSLGSAENAKKLIELFGDSSNMDPNAIANKGLKYLIDNKLISPEDWAKISNKGLALDAIKDGIRTAMSAAGK